MRRIWKYILKFVVVFFSTQLLCDSNAIDLDTSIRIALTVDDLPSHGSLPLNYSRTKVAEDFLQRLDNNNIHGVYGFVVGNRIDKNTEEVMSLWGKKGHFFANHTYHHLDLTSVSAQKFIDDIALNDSIVFRKNGSFVVKYFRFPFLHEGNTYEKRSEVRRYLKDRKYVQVPVTISYNDYLFNDPITRCLAKNDFDSLGKIRMMHVNHAKEVLKSILALSNRIFSRQIPHILLIHLGLSQSIWFEDVIRVYKEAGVSWVSLEEALKDPIYNIDPGLPFDRGGLFALQIARAKGFQFNPTPNLETLTKELLSFCR